jgi:hypothetical protein
MGYRPPFLVWIDEHITKIFSSTTNLKMLELGNQIIKGGVPNGERTGKAYYTNQGFEHTSVDLNGLDGSLVKDLSNLDDFAEYKDYFDVITNAGTIEHVEPFEAQYTAYLNVHNSLKIGGVALHIGPDINFTKKNHCQYYYDKEFYDTIVENSDYEFLGTENILNWRHYAYRKVGNKFIDKELLLSKIHKTNGPVGGMYIDGKDKKAKQLKKGKAQ